MNPQDPIRDLMRRTMENLRFIEDNAKVYGLYEVTQLVNSFLAALAPPWEEYKHELNERSLEEAIAEGWPVLKKEKPEEDQTPASLGEQIAWIRHSFAHGNIEFQSTGGNEITHIRFWNKKHGKRRWGTIAYVDTMRRFLEKFVELAEELTTADVQRASKVSA